MNPQLLGYHVSTSTSKWERDGITFHRYQFPVGLCHALTINKSQGQVDLKGSIFCRHGQLYVAVNRSTCRDNILCLVDRNYLVNDDVHNVVFSEFIVQ